MHILCDIFGYGFNLQVNYYNFDTVAKNHFALAFLWKGGFPKWSFKVSTTDSGGHVRFTTSGKDGRHKGWEFRGPIQRIQ